MKTIVVGFDNEKGFGSATLLAGPNVSASEQIAIVQDAKQKQQFPKGIKRLALCLFEERTIAIKIEPEKKSETEKEK